MHITARRVLIALMLLVVAVGLATSAPAGAKARTCPTERGTLAGGAHGRLWHRGTSLYGCTLAFGRAPRAQRLGPWTPGTQVAWDGVNAVWTVRHTTGGVTFDRAWVASAIRGVHWLIDSPLVPTGAGQPITDARAQKLFVEGDSAGWVTEGGQVVLMMFLPDGDATAVGALPAPLLTDKQLTLVGTFTAINASALAVTVTIAIGDGETDDCGGSNPYTLTLQPSPSGPRVGATRFGTLVTVDPKECNL